MTKHHILIVDDDVEMQTLLRITLEAHYQLTIVGDVTQALLEFGDAAKKYDLVLTDVQLPGLSGLHLAEELRARNIDVPIVVMTAYGSVQTAVAAMKDGVFDYILKPINLDELKLSIGRALRVQSLENENSVLRQTVKGSWNVADIIGKSAAIRAVFDVLQRVAPTQANVFITGETGTGKEIFARAIHNLSPRASKAFVPINCSAIPAELLESELFGHTKGSFTGAHQDRKGLFEEAQGGTVFLDEIGDMEVSLQAKLLRVLQERKIKPVGGSKQRDIDVRVIAATHKDLKSAIREGRFREDLYYRLCVIPMALPALRQRKEDIPLLAEHFFKKHVATHGLKVRGITPQAMGKIIEHSWEGNVRELENFIERAAILCVDDWISEEGLPFNTLAGASSTSESPNQFLDAHFSENLTLRELEKRYINMILRKTGMRKEKTAQILGVDRKTLYRKEREFGVSVSQEAQATA